MTTQTTCQSHGDKEKMREFSQNPISGDRNTHENDAQNCCHDLEEEKKILI